MEPKVSTKTSVRDYRSTLRKIPKIRICDFCELLKQKDFLCRVLFWWTFCKWNNLCMVIRLHEIEFIALVFLVHCCVAR